MRQGSYAQVKKSHMIDSDRKRIWTSRGTTYLKDRSLAWTNQMVNTWLKATFSMTYYTIGSWQRILGRIGLPFVP